MLVEFICFKNPIRIKQLFLNIFQINVSLTINHYAKQHCNHEWINVPIIKLDFAIATDITLFLYFLRLAALITRTFLKWFIISLLCTCAGWLFWFKLIHIMRLLIRHDLGKTGSNWINLCNILHFYLFDDLLNFENCSYLF